MITKQPFTPAGVQALLSELYQLPQAKLQAEADEANQDFSAWLLKHFDFSASQIGFLHGLGAALVKYYGAITSFSLENRSAIILIKDETNKKIAGDEPVYKLIRSKDEKKEETASTAVKSGTEGMLTFEITYKN